MTCLLKKLPRRPCAPRFFKEKRGLYVLLLFVLLFLIITLPIFPQFIITDGDTGKIVYHKATSVNDEFMIRYIHSTNLTPVEEYYRINKNFNIRLFELRYQSYSVGMPSSLEKGEKMVLKNGEIIIENMNRVFPYFDQRIGQVIANHTLTIDNKTIKFSDIDTPGSMVRIRATKLSIFELLGVYRP